MIYKHTVSDVSWKCVPTSIGLAIALMDGERTVEALAREMSRLLDLPGTDEALVFYEQAVTISNEVDTPFLVDTGDGCGEITRVNVKKFLELYNKDEDAAGLKMGRLEVPLQPVFMPTNRCETNCVYCYAERRPVRAEDTLTPERWCQLIDEAGSHGMDMLVFSGGDPLLYPGIDRLLERLVAWKIIYALPTKTAISAGRAGELAGLCGDVGTVQISIDGVNPDVVDALVGKKGFCEAAWASLAHLIRAGLRVRTQSVITPLNIGDVPVLVRRLHEIGVPEATITNYARSFYRHKDSLFLTSGQMDWLNDVVLKAKAEFSWEGLNCNAGVNDPCELSREQKMASWKTRVGCSGGRSGMVITPNGDVILCEQMPQESPFVVGNVREASFMEVWRSPEVALFTVPPRDLFAGTACEKCDEFDLCHKGYGRCFRDAYFTYRKLWHPPPMCPWSPPGIRLG